MVDDLIIVGSGPAGLTAAIYAAREGFKPLMINGINEGGQLTLTAAIENYPGFPDGILGPDLIALMKKQAEKFGTRFAGEEVQSVDFSKRPFRLKTNSSEYEARCVIIATGANSHIEWMRDNARGEQENKRCE